MAWSNRVAAATLLSSLFLLSVGLAYFPQLDSIKAFSIDLRLRKSLDRADEILGKIKDISEINAKATYINIAWSNRFGGMSNQEKQDLIDALNEQLNAIGLTEVERRVLSKPCVDLIGYDLYIVYVRVVRAMILHHNDDAQRALLTKWDSQTSSLGVEGLRPALGSSGEFKKWMGNNIPKDIDDADELLKLHNMIDQLANLFEQCIQYQGYTKAMIEFFDGPAKKATSLPEDAYAYLVQNF